MSSITEEDCVKALETKLGHKDFTVENFAMKPVTKVLGFLSRQAELTVIVRVRGRPETHNFFVKIFDKGNSRLSEEFLHRQKINIKEVRVLQKLIPDLEDVASKKITSKWYHGIIDRFMILEHLSETGFEPCRRTEVDEIHARIGIETLANFHAMSFISERQWNVSLGDKYKDMLYETIAVILEDDPETGFLYGANQRLRCFIRECLEDFTDIDSYADRLTQKFIDLSTPSTRFKNIICHGDCWKNNIMYKYDENGIPEEAILVDYQMVHFVPPAHDLVYFMGMNIPHGLRETHESHLLGHYYTTLTKCLDKHGIKVDEVLPESELLESFRHFNEEYGTLVRLFYIFPLIPEEHMPKIFGNDELIFETSAKGNLPAFLEILKSSPEFKQEIKIRLLNALKFHKA